MKPNLQSIKIYKMKKLLFKIPFLGLQFSRIPTVGLILVLQLQASAALADSPTYFTVTRASPTTQQLDGDVLADPNAANIDGLLFSKLAADFQELRVQRDVVWYSNAAGFNQKYEHIRVEGNDKNTDSLALYSETVRDTGCFFYDLKIRSLDITDAQVVISDQESGSPGLPGCVRPIDFFVTSNSNAVATEIALDNGILNLSGRQLLVQSVPLTINALSGTSAILKPGNESFAANPLQIDVAPSATLQMIPLAGSLTRLSVAPNITLDASTFEVFSETASGNLVWGLAARNGQDFVVSNASTLRVGNGTETFRFGLAFAADEGIQVNASTIEVTSFGTLSSSILLNGSTVQIADFGHLVSDRIWSQGNAQIVASDQALETSLGGLEVSSGTLIIAGGKTQFQGTNFSMIKGTLQLGKPGDASRPSLFFADTTPRNLLTPRAEIFFDAGSRLTGSANIAMNANAHALFFSANSTLEPDPSIGSITLDGQLFMEDGSTLKVEANLSLVNSGLAQSDAVVLNAPYGYLSLGLGNGTLLDLSLLNDGELPAGTKLRLITYPNASAWNGTTFAGLPNGHIFQQGANWWQINYDEPLVPGLESVVPVRTVTLTVVESQLSLTPSVINFGSQLIGNPSTEQFFTLANSGLAPLELTTVTSSNMDYAKTSDNCTGVTLNAGQNCTVGFVFTPAVVGTDISNLVINGVVSGALVGQGIPTIGSGVALTPSFLNFGDVDINTANGPLKTVLDNSSGAALTQLTITIEGSTQFNQTSNCPASLANAGNCTIDVSFAPLIVGQDGAVLRVFSNGVRIAEAALIGTGITEPLVTLNPGTLDFGNQLVGVPSAPQPFLVENSGTANLVISSLSTSGADYSIENDNCSGVAIPPGGNCSVSVVFTPTVTGSDPAGLSVLSNAKSSPDTLNLIGTGAGPILSLDRTSVGFGPQAVGVPSAPQTVVLTNTGNAPLDISKIVSSSSEFTTDGGDCVGATLVTNASCSFNVILTGNAVHLATGIITIQSNAASSPDTVQVNGDVLDVQPANFLVTKSYSDDSQDAVEVEFTCSGEPPLKQSAVIAPDNQANFTLTQFRPGETHCQITETDPPAGYLPRYDNGISSATENCEYLHLESGGQYSCQISNEALSEVQPARFSIAKKWLVPEWQEDIPLEDVTVTVSCNQNILSVDSVPVEVPTSFVQFLLADGQIRELSVDPTDGDARCTATETVEMSDVEEDSDGCIDVELSAGAEKNCIFTNTLGSPGFPVPVPALNWGGLVALLLLLLGTSLTTIVVLRR